MFARIDRKASAIDDFGLVVHSEPNPKSVSALAGLGAKLIQLDVRELQVSEEPLVQ